MYPKSLAGILKRAYPNLDIKRNFNDRIRIQKFVYLLREYVGIDLLYDFDFYLYGPYSTDLTHDAFQIENYGKIKPIKFKEKTLEKKFKKFHTFIKKYNTPEELEIIASARYIHNAYPRKNINQIVEEIKLKREGELKESKIRKTIEKIKGELLQ